MSVRSFDPFGIASGAVVLAALTSGSCHQVRKTGPIVPGSGAPQTLERSASFGAPVHLASPASIAPESPEEWLSTAQPTLTSLRGGLAMLWVEHRAQDPTHALFWSRMRTAPRGQQPDDGYGWSQPELIGEASNWFVNWADLPHFVVGQHSVLAQTLVKSGEETYDYDVCLTRRLWQKPSHSKLWSDLEVLHDDGVAAEHGFASLGLEPSSPERFFVTWLDGRNTRQATESGSSSRGAMTLRAAWLDQEGRKFDDQELDASVCDCCPTDIAMHTDGPIVVYRDRSPEEERGIALVKHRNGVWSAPIAVSTEDWVIAGCPVNGPQIAISPAGSQTAGPQTDWLAVAWFTAANDRAEVRLRFSHDDAESFEAPLTVNSSASGNALGRVQLSALDSECVALCWMEESPSRPGRAKIQLAWFSVHGERSEVLTVLELENSRRSGCPQMLVCDDRIYLATTRVLEERADGSAAITPARTEVQLVVIELAE